MNLDFGRAPGTLMATAPKDLLFRTGRERHLYTFEPKAAVDLQNHLRTDIGCHELILLEPLILLSCRVLSGSASVITDLSYQTFSMPTPFTASALRSVLRNLHHHHHHHHKLEMNYTVGQKSESHIP